MQSFQPIARRCSQIIQHRGRIDRQQLGTDSPLNLLWKIADSLARFSEQASPAWQQNERRQQGVIATKINQSASGRPVFTSADFLATGVWPPRADQSCVPATTAARRRLCGFADGGWHKRDREIGVLGYQRQYSRVIPKPSAKGLGSTEASDLWGFFQNLRLVCVAGAVSG
jgi:hypothetical protein